MQVVLHAGAHKTDDDRLLRCLIANRTLLADHGTDVPGPTGYRKPIRDALHAASQGGISDTVRDDLLSAMVTSDSAERMVLSNPGFFGTPKMAAAGGILYGAAESRLGHFQQLFPQDEIELFFSIRNPATFLPALLEHTPFDTVDAFLRDNDPGDIRWSDLFSRLRTAYPGIPITVWCNEDTPLIWAELLREMGGLDPTEPFEGEFSLLSEIMSPVGMERFQAYLATHPKMTEIQKRRVIAAFLDKFAKKDAIEEEVDVPGWTDAVVERLTYIYDEDIFEIQRIPGVTLITA